MSMIRLMNFSMVTKAHKSLKPILLILMLNFLALTLSGCQLIKETFGKEYRLIDNAFDQLEADITFTTEEFIAEKKLADDKEAELRTRLDQLCAELNVSREEMKSAVRLGKNYMDELGTNMSMNAYVEKAIMDVRVGTDEILKKNWGMALKHAEVNRGIWGSIWYFIRNHWLISLIILGIIGNIPEFVGTILSRQKK